MFKIQKDRSEHLPVLGTTNRLGHTPTALTNTIDSTLLIPLGAQDLTAR